MRKGPVTMMATEYGTRLDNQGVSRSATVDGVSDFVNLYDYLCPCQLATGERFRKSQFLVACRVSAPPFGMDDGTAACLTGR